MSLYEITVMTSLHGKQIYEIHFAKNIAHRFSTWIITNIGSGGGGKWVSLPKALLV